MDIRVKVIPKSSRTELTGYLPDGTWKVKVAAAPDKGKANRALCEFVAEKLGVAKSRVRSVAGERMPFEWSSSEGIRGLSHITQHDNPPTLINVFYEPDS